jgi:hypothetical protein
MAPIHSVNGVASNGVASGTTISPPTIAAPASNDAVFLRAQYPNGNIKSANHPALRTE